MLGMPLKNVEEILVNFLVQFDLEQAKLLNVSVP